jgi:NADPH2:quinone reductase
MRRVVCKEFSDPVRLELVEELTPRPGPGEMLVEVEAAAATFVDGLIARGL